MRKEIPSAGMSAHLGSEPLLHTANLGVEFIIRRMTNEIHPVQVDKGKDREHIRLVEGGTGKRGDLRGGGGHIYGAGQLTPTRLPATARSLSPSAFSVLRL